MSHSWLCSLRSIRIDIKVYLHNSYWKFTTDGFRIASLRSLIEIYLVLFASIIGLQILHQWIELRNVCQFRRTILFCQEVLAVDHAMKIFVNGFISRKYLLLNNFYYVTAIVPLFYYSWKILYYYILYIAGFRLIHY